MQRVLALTLVLLAVAFGQSRTTVNYLNSTGTTLGAITNLAADPNALAPVIYAYLVPENAGLLQITLENLNNDDCYYLDYYIISDVLPCYEDTFGLGDADRSFCNFYTSSYSGSYPVTFEAQPGQGSSYFKYQTNKYVYIGVGTESTYSGSVCSYSLTVNLNNTCATGSVAAYTGDDLPICQPVTMATLSNFTSSVTGANSTDFTKLWEFDVPVGTAYVSFTVAATEYFYMYGSQNAATAGYSTYDCYDSASSDNGVYYTTLTCYTPESGKFYAYFELTTSPDDDTFNYNITSAIKVCPDNMLGENCEFPAQALNISNLQTVNVVIPYNSSVDTYAFLYFDIPAGNTWTDNIQLNYYLNNVTNNEGIYSQVTKNTIAVEDVERYSTQEQYIYRGETDYWVFSWQDWAVPSRIYIGFQCYTASTGGNCNVTVSFNTSVITTGTTGTATTGTATTVSTGTATTVSTGTATTVSTGTATTVSTGTATTVSTGTSSTTTSGNVTITTSSASAVFATAALVLIAALF